MSVKIRLQRRGRKKQPFYHIVIADARAPRDGKFIEKIGTYNPMTVPATIELDRERAYEWLQKGAQPTETTRSILRFKGVMFKKHLMRGVAKGAMTTEEADVKYQEWIDAKEVKIEARRQKVVEEKVEWNKKISGVAKKVASPLAGPTEDEHKPDKESQKSFAESVEQTTVESMSASPAPEAEAPAKEPAKKEETPKKEAPAAKEEAPKKEAPAKEAPAAEETPKVEEAPAAEEKPAAEEAPVAEKAPEKEAPAAKEETPKKEAPKKEAPAADSDDLTKIEGIGPKIAEVLNNGGLTTFAALAAASADSIKEMLTTAEGNFGSHDPTTWSAQSKMAADGEWDKLKVWQDELDGGKEVKASGEEE